MLLFSMFYSESFLTDILSSPISMGSVFVLPIVGKHATLGATSMLLEVCPSTSEKVDEVWFDQQGLSGPSLLVASALHLFSPNHQVGKLWLTGYS
jgi:hypothetical protein